MAAFLGHQRATIAASKFAPAIVAARPMANIASQVKRIHRTDRERDENRRLQSAVKTHFRRVERAAQAGDAELTAREHRELVSHIDKAVQKGALHPNNGARKKARAARLVSEISA
jgi:small subunit ribosomal protein S20